jgi:pyruvate dehydrogenase E1 component beta subunit
MAVKAVDALRDEGVTADIIDLRTVKPIDEGIIFESIKKTGKILIVDTGWLTGGVCAEIGCLVAEKAFEYLKAPVRRIALPDLPHPAGFALEQYYYPDEARIAKVILEMVGKGVSSEMANGI